MFFQLRKLGGSGFDTSARILVLLSWLLERGSRVEAAVVYFGLIGEQYNHHPHVEHHLVTTRHNSQLYPVKYIVIIIIPQHLYCTMSYYYKTFFNHDKPYQLNNFISLRVVSFKKMNTYTIEITNKICEYYNNCSININISPEG